ncbi:MAG: hypothetical protein L6R42_000756 [Xanthoria sp. 1 TBL-2021]|nr:MAG: hypothetical protein L6R42_000756 [Xanthoria sp. 1 TBL-2021]
MKPVLKDRLLWRELGYTSRYTTIKGLYGDRSLVENLDIVNELGGHSGCVNALSWSSSGRLLASGSDDQHLNIHSYQPESSTAQFALNTTVSTGHSANIFSVKFMPHSDDRTIVTCAGDCEVRVVDIENSGRTTIPSGTTDSTTRRAQLHNMYKGVQYLSHGDTNTRVYRSHADRVKRIVTESSPFLFLTCSEDGEVRQFDLRLPSSAYPSPSGGRGLFARRKQHDDSNVPPPLISYKRHHLDLNTISCSATQPHYIALGGAHLHCFLHDRRMLGRDRLTERGTPGIVTPAGSMSSAEEETMTAATRCVRRFAPNGKNRMRRTDNGHITACKISDANPNELIASWSGDQIYSFDILRSPDASNVGSKGPVSSVGPRSSTKVKETADKKRKRTHVNVSASPERTRTSAGSRRTRSPTSATTNVALRVQYENGQSEDIAMNDPVMTVPSAVAENARESVLNDSQKRSLRIAISMVKIRKTLFSLSDTSVESCVDPLDPSAHKASFTSVVGFSASLLPEMDEISRSWRYPLEPRDEDIVFQQTLRGHRDTSRRFVQAAGTLAKVLGGRLQMAGGSSHLSQYFQQISPAPHEGSNASEKEIFSFDFLKAILLWLEGGPQALLQGFKRPVNQRKDNPRFPIPDEADHAGIDDYLIPYLLRLASSRAIPNVDASRFERDEHRQAFRSETSAVIAFSSAIRMPLEDLSRALMPSREDPSTRTTVAAQDKKAAIRFWGFKVGRGLLMNAGEGVNYQYVDIAFGGLGIARVDEGRLQEDVDPNEMEEVVDTVSVIQRRSTEDGDDVSNGELATSTADQGAPSASREPSMDIDDAGSDAEVVLVDDIHNEIAEHMAHHDEHENEVDEDDEDEDDGGDHEHGDGNADDSDDDITEEERQFIFRSASNRGKSREMVEADVPYSSHTRAYSGHCNVKTVKDANFFGLNDEYVVSGSDGGHLFIWDKKTSELVNILQGDNEVVNVVQGHPYEPVLAVSGIDSTIKIFSPDNRAQEDARAGINVGYPDNGYTIHSSLSGRRRRARQESSEGEDGAAEGLSSRKRMDRREEIIRENDVQRQGGMREAFITRGMLAQLSARLRARQAAAGEGGDGEAGDEGVPIVVDDSCSIM